MQGAEPSSAPCTWCTMVHPALQPMVGFDTLAAAPQEVSSTEDMPALG